MCETCYKGYGSPEIDNDNVRDLIAAIEDLYWVHGAGGALHIVVDDWNLEDEHVEWCREWAEELRDGFDDLERACYDALTECTVAERASALAANRTIAFPTGEIVVPDKSVDNGDGTWTLTFAFGIDDEI